MTFYLDYKRQKRRYQIRSGAFSLENTFNGRIDSLFRNQAFTTLMGLPTRYTFIFPAAMPINALTAFFGALRHIVEEWCC